MKSEWDNVIANDKWEFDESVSACFENMLQRSIPQYDVMRSTVADLSYAVISSKPKKETYQILDIGCSDGLMLDTLINKFDGYGTGYFYGVDVSEPMLSKAKLRLIGKSNVSIFNCDLRKKFPVGHYDIITSVLTLQFIPIEYRQQIIQNIYDNLSSVKGCFLFVEKVLGNSAQLNELFVDLYYQQKIKNGYSAEQIERKRLSLEGVLVPVTNDWNVQLLKQAGFKQIDVFWRWMNFVGYIAIK